MLADALDRRSEIVTYVVEVCSRRGDRRFEIANRPSLPEPNRRSVSAVPAARRPEKPLVGIYAIICVHFAKAKETDSENAQQT